MERQDVHRVHHDCGHGTERAVQLRQHQHDDPVKGDACDSQGHGGHRRW